MKKLLLITMVAMMSFALSSCEDTKFESSEINVLFFTANEGATQVDPYLNIDSNVLISEPIAPTRIGYIFDGWYKDFLRTIPWDFEQDLSGDTSFILYAKWIPEIYTITYDLNGGNMLTSDFVTEFQVGDNKVLPQASRTGYNFVAWYTYDWVDESSTKPGDVGYQVVPSSNAEDLFLYAHWEPVVVRVTFLANYPGEDGPSNPATLLLDYGTIIDFTQLEDTQEYSFIGWNTRSDGQGTFYVNGDEFVRTQRITLYGIWELKD